MVRRAYGGLVLATVFVTTARAGLLDYVGKKDASYRWSKVASSAPNAPLQYAQLHMISQTWQGTAWQHRLLVARPASLKDASHALLIIGGGSWREGLEKEAIKDDSRELQLAMAITTAAQMPVVFLTHVPFQPLFDGRKEDQIIAYTFDKFLNSGDEEWPLLLPMTKAAVRAMDTVQAFAGKEWKVDIARFIVTGGSKRGWTTWLTGASDPRVCAIAPMVIDTLNMGRQMHHQKEVYGGFSEQIKDYTQLKIQDRMDTPEGKKLLSIVDPYSYRQRLTMPKLLLLGTNDPYWALDALNLYYDDLKGEKYIQYIPNAGHGLDGDRGRLVSDIAAFALKGAGKLDFPKLTWQIEKRDESYHFIVRSDPPPESVSFWYATSDTQDFRKSRFIEKPVEGKDGAFTYELRRPASGFAAALGDVHYMLEGHPLYLSTNVRIIGPEPTAKQP